MKNIKKLLCVTLLLTIIGCGGGNKKPEKVTITNSVPLESVRADMSKYTWIEEPYGDFEEITLAQASQLIKEKGSGIIYIGYVTCPFCERAIPLLNEVAVEYGVPIYYVDAHSDRAPTDQELDEFIELADSTFDVDEYGEKAFLVPEVIGVKQGELVAWQVSLVDGFHLEDETSQMTDQQKEELKEIYREIILKTAD